jgi:hypothetical protein
MTIASSLAALLPERYAKQTIKKKGGGTKKKSNNNVCDTHQNQVYSFGLLGELPVVVVAHMSDRNDELAECKRFSRIDSFAHSITHATRTHFHLLYLSALIAQFLCEPVPLLHKIYVAHIRHIEG